MFRRKKKERLTLEFAREAEIIKTIRRGDVIIQEVKSNRPIPPAKHGTIKLKGKQI